MKGKKPPSLTIEEAADSLFDADELAQLRKEYGFDEDDEQTAILTPETRTSLANRLKEKSKRIGCLIVLTGEESGKVLQLQEVENVLGRSKSATLPLIGHGISRFHACIKKRPGVRGDDAYFVEDLQSKNGTFVNGQAATRPTALRDGDLLTLGGAFLLKFKQIDNTYLHARQEGQISQIRGGVIRINDQKQVTFINQYARDALQAGPWQSPEDTYELAMRHQLIRPLEMFPEHDDIEVWQTQVERSLYRCHGIPLFKETDEPELFEAHGAIFMFMDASLDSMLEREMNLVSQQLLVASQRANVARRAAEQANQAKSEFLARMSHELRTPLNAIIGYSELLMEEVGHAPSELLTTDLEKIRTAGRHLLDLIDEVLDISRLEAGKMELNVDLFEVDDLVKTLEELTQSLANKNNNQLVIERVGPLGKILSDRLKVRQILYNILSNACKFTHDGVIKFTATKRDIDGQTWFELTVKDSGIGMTQDELRHVFQAFYQVESTSTRRFQGTGLGLTISKKFCDLLGGQIELASEPGKGTTFIVRLPQQCPTPI